MGLALPFPWAAGSAAGDKASTFLDPAINVTRLSGKGKVLMATPMSSANGNRTPLEAWRTASELPGESRLPALLSSRYPLLLGAYKARQVIWPGSTAPDFRCRPKWADGAPWSYEWGWWAGMHQGRALGRNSELGA